MDKRVAETAGSVPAGQLETLRRLEQAPNYNAWLLERSKPYLGRRILDIGAGTGTFTEALSKDCDHIVALEPDPVMFELLRERFAASPNVTLSKSDAAGLASASFEESFDSIICFNVLEHIADDREALDVFLARLRPGGCLLLLVPAHPTLYGSMDETVGHERRYRRAPLRKLLEEVGFRPEVIRYVNPIGAVGWFVSARILRSEYIPRGPLRLYDRLIPLFRALDRIDLGFGLSLWAVARRGAA
jgi:SAM-dependent methyltransferase